MIAVVDTNVAVVANKNHPEASPQCVLSCIQAMEELKLSGKLVLDDRWRIIREYQNNLSSTGQPGYGDAFLKWVLRNRENPLRCQQVTIHPIDGSETDFEEFPKDPALQALDPSDRKFVAVALAHSSRPPIWNATDTDWWELRAELSSNGLQIRFLCQNDVERFSSRENG
jgi:hypothetical protein